MKVALTTDFLFERDNLIEILELACETFPDSNLYTLSHRLGGVLGVINERSIQSSFLSHKMLSYSQLDQYLFSFPTASKNITIPCSNDLVISFSRGFSHGIKKCKNTKQITYLYDFIWETYPLKKWYSKFFLTYIKNWSLKKLSQSDEIWVSCENLKKVISPYFSNVHVIEPFFKVHEYPKIKSSSFNYDYWVIDVSELSSKSAKIIVNFLSKENVKFKFVGMISIF